MSYEYNDSYDLEELIDTLNNKISKIADLEAKLAESESELEKWSTQYARAYVVRQNDLIAENAELKQQLAEKEKEIKQLKLDLGMYKSVNEFINSYGIEKAREVLLQTEKTKNQDKISFCIEQLEKVKEELDKHDKIETFVDIYGDSAVNRSDLEFFIDNQIKQLKEMK